jgi:hypothetical protein
MLCRTSREHLLELDECPHRGLLDSAHRCASCGPEPDRDRDRLIVVQKQRRHRGPGPQPIAARGSSRRLDRVAEVAQSLDVAPERPARDLEPLGKL